MIFSKLFSEQWYQQVECLAESMFVETWGWNNNYHLEKKLYQQEIIHILKDKSKSIIYLAVHQGIGDNNQGEVARFCGISIIRDQPAVCFVVQR